MSEYKLMQYNLTNSNQAKIFLKNDKIIINNNKRIKYTCKNN